MNKYIERVLAETKAKNANEPEFLQTVEEVLSSLEPVIDAIPSTRRPPCWSGWSSPSASSSSA